MGACKIMLLCCWFLLEASVGKYSESVSMRSLCFRFEKNVDLLELCFLAKLQMDELGWIEFVKSKVYFFVWFDVLQIAPISLNVVMSIFENYDKDGID
jgi:hypothetical protein